MRIQLFTQTLLSFFAICISMLAYGQLQVITTLPVNNADKVQRDANIVLDFNTPVDGATVNASNIIIRGDHTGILPGTFSGGGTNTITFDPTNDFFPEEKITVTLTTALMNTSAQPLTADYTIIFHADQVESNYLQTSFRHDVFIVNYPYYMAPIDIDEDGDMDIFNATQFGVTLLQNDGNQNFTNTSIFSGFAREAHPVDMDNDGDIDVVCSIDGGAHVWLENDGSQNFTVQPLATTSGSENYLQVADLDGDGDMDVVGGRWGGDVYWFENDGNQNFTINTLISGTNGKRGRIRDLDQDGDLDIIWNGNGNLVWLENDGNEVFTNHVIHTSSYQDADVADMDNDGDLDIVAAGSDLDWFENDGSQSFTQHFINTNSGHHLRIADMDGEGLKDIVIGGVTEVMFYRGDRAQNFDRHILATAGAGAGLTMAEVADIDGDGDMDVTYSLGVNVSNVPIGWIEFDTMLVTTPAQFEENVSTSSSIVMDFEESIDAASVNNDNFAVRGELSGRIAGTLSGGGTNTITFNPTTDFLPGESIEVTIRDSVLHSNGKRIFAPYTFEFRAEATPHGIVPTSYTKHLIADTLANVDLARPADIDGDGDMDVLTIAISDNEIIWYENDGTQNYTDHIVDNTIKPTHAELADLDEDGDWDIIAANDADQLYWYENDGAQNFTRHALPVIPASYANVGAFDMQVSDMEGDGDLDLVFSTTIPYLCWFENDGNENFTFVNTAGPNVAFNRCLKTDVDGDGDMDVVTLDKINDNLAVFDNDGEVNLAPYAINNSPSTGAHGLAAGDMDKDGDNDIIYMNTDGVTWLENQGALGFAEHPIHSGLMYFGDVYAMDIDADNDLDIVIGTGITDTIFWFENDGSQNFTQHFVYTGDYVSQVNVADMDGDGDMDIIASALSDNELFWLEFSCTLADVPVVTGPSIQCPGPDATLTWTGNLNDATQWYIHTDSCTGPIVDSTTANTIDVNPSVTTTYFIEGGGACGGAGCGSVTVPLYSEYNISETVAVHEGDSYTFPDGTMQTILMDSVVQTSFFTTVNGCDSIIETTVLMVGTPPNGTCDNVLNFDGSDDYTHQGQLLHPNNQFTVEFWANIDNSWQWKHIVENGGVEATYDAAYRVEIGNEGELYCALGNGSGFQSTGTLNLGWQYNEWNHYAYTYDGDTARVFFNGIEVHKYYASGMDITGGDGTVIFGSFAGGTRFYDGRLDEVRIWDAARTQQEIVANKDLQLTGAETDLLGYWDFNDGYGTVLSDLSPVPNNGALISMSPITGWVTVDGLQVNSQQSATICDNETFTVGTSSHTMTGVYVDALTTAQGCDSVVVTSLTVIPTITNTLGDIAICAGDSALIFGNYESIAGSYVDSLTAVNGCDSLVILNLIVNPLPIQQTVSASQTVLCDNGTVAINVDATETGVEYTLYETGTNNLIDGPIAGTGSSISFDPGMISTTTEYYVTAENIATALQLDGVDDWIRKPDGTCATDNDNNVTMECWFNWDGNISQAEYLLYNGEASANGYGLRISPTGELRALFGFVSFLNTGYIVTPGQWTHVALTGDASDNWTIYVDGVLISSAVINNIPPANNFSIGGPEVPAALFGGMIDEVRVWETALTQTEIQTNMSSCLSGNEMDLVAYFSFQKNFLDNTGNGNSVDSIGYNGVSPWTASTTGNCGTCNSEMLNTITIGVNASSSQTATATICNGDSYTLGTQTLTTAGTYTEVFTGTNGCDSTVTLTLNVNPVFSETITATICDGDSYTLGTQTLTTAGTYTEVFTAMNGCDSTVTLTLNVNPTYNETATADICDGDSFTFGTQTLTASGTYTEVFATVNGCDSTVTLTLNVNPTYNETATADICDGDSFTFGTQTLTTSGTYTEVFSTVNGCDSTVVLTLNVNPVYNETAMATICDGDSYTFGTQTLTTAGTYTEVFQSVHGCDSTVVLTLNVNPVYNETETATICDGESYTFGTQTLTTAGTYTEVFSTVNGCDSTVELTLTVNTVDATVSVSGHTITANNANATYQWIECVNGTPIAGATSQDFTPTANGIYAVIVTENNCSDTSDCETISTIGLDEQTLISVSVYPNPNHGKFWLELDGETSSEVNVQIFNMLGQIIHTSEVTGSGKHEFDLGTVEPGVYNMQISYGSGIELKQIVVK